MGLGQVFLMVIGNFQFILGRLYLGLSLGESALQSLDRDVTSLLLQSDLGHSLPERCTYVAVLQSLLKVQGGREGGGMCVDELLEIVLRHYSSFRGVKGIQL